MKTTKISTWLLWSPLKFALGTLVALSVVSFLYTILIRAFYSSATIMETPVMILCGVTGLSCIILTIRKLLRAEMNHASFVGVYNAQAFIGLTLYILISYMIISNINQIIFRLNLMGAQLTPKYLVMATFYAIMALYLIGLLVANMAAKIRRIKDFKIPMWKIILSVPFGFSALWIPGYILNQTNKKNTYVIETPQWYQRLNNKIISKPIYTILTFIASCLFSASLFGDSGVLFTACLALIFGIWVLQVGKKRFIENIGKTYTTVAILVNLVLLATMTVLVIYIQQFI